LIDVNDENLIAIPDEDRTTAAGREHRANMYLNDRFVHRVDGTDGRAKNKPLSPKAPVVAAVPAALRGYVCSALLLMFFLNRPCMFRRINNCPHCSP